MRIVGGQFKGRRVELKAASARPTSDKVREALFSILYDRTEDSAFLDLFTGSGCVGLEALSRGAARVVFCDKDPRAIAALRENLIAFRAQEGTYDLMTGSYDTVCAKLARSGNTFDLIYLDPPYDAGYYEESLRLASGLIRPGGWVMAEHRSSVELPEACSGLTKLQSRRYGSQTVSFYERRETK